MLKKTNLEKVKDIAISFLYLDIKINEQFPCIVSHPFSDSPIQFNGENTYNITDMDGHKIFVDTMKAKIEQIEKYNKFSYLITKPYRSAFLKYTKQYINREDLSIFLKDLWVGTETVNVDTNISKNQFVKLFKAADPDFLMTGNERSILDSFAEEITVYRGINNTTNHPKNGLSWTPEYETALWFAKRYASGGEILKTNVKKNDILAYFEYENETVIDYTKLKDIKTEKSLL